MQSLALTWTRFRVTLGRSPEAVALITLLVVFLVFAIIAPHFLTVLSIAQIATFGSTMGIIVVGVAMLMIAGEFDLSVGSNFALASYVWAILMNGGMPPVAALVIAVLCSTTLGLVNGIIVVWSKLPSFIVTLGTMLAYRGIVRAIGHSDFAKYTASRPILFDILNTPITFLNDLVAKGTNFRLSIVWFILAAVVGQWILTRTRLGNWVYATGGNAAAALQQGVPVRRVKLTAFALVGFLVGLASAIEFAMRTSVDPARGEGWELTAVAACVIGGVSLTGGAGSIIGASLGMMLLMTLQQGLVLVGASVDVFQGIAGLILILAVILNLNLSRES